MSSSLLVIPSTSGSSLRNIDAEGRWVENEFTRRRWTSEEKAKLRLMMMNLKYSMSEVKLRFMHDKYVKFVDEVFRRTLEKKIQAVRHWRRILSKIWPCTMSSWRWWLVYWNRIMRDVFFISCFAH